MGGTLASHLRRTCGEAARPHLCSSLTTPASASRPTPAARGVPSRSRRPPKVPLPPPRSQRTPGTPRPVRPAPRLRPAAPAPRAAPRGARLPSARPRSSALGPAPRRRALRAGSGVGVTSGSRRGLPVLAAVGSVRPGSSASPSPPQPPAAVAAAARFSGSGSDVTAGAERGRGAGVREGRTPRLCPRPDPRCPARLCVPTPRPPGPKPPGAPAPCPPLYAAQCSESPGPGEAAGVQREETGGPKGRGQGFLGEGSGAEVGSPR